jgi:hypothetical protein
MGVPVLSLLGVKPHDYRMNATGVIAAAGSLG